MTSHAFIHFHSCHFSQLLRITKLEKALDKCPIQPLSIITSARIGYAQRVMKKTGERQTLYS